MPTVKKVKKNQSRPVSERRKIDFIILDTLQNFKEESDKWRQEASENLEVVKKEVQTLQQNLFEFKTSEESRIKKLEEAFPEEDLAVHRHYHELISNKEKCDANLKQNIKERLITGGLWSLLVLIGLALWEYAKTSIK